jgi:formylglycine-generating enzyme required for sulfatase activity
MKLSAFFLLVFLTVAAALGEPASSQEATSQRDILTNSIGMRLVRIPAGEFMMGGTEPAEELSKAYSAYERKPEEFSDEYPRHKVRITRPFLLGQYEVTIGQFRTFTEDANYKTQAEFDGTGGWGYDPKTGMCSGRHPQFNWRNPGFPQTDEQPVLNVTWHDCAAFCDWLSGKDGKRYRLPTEAEWEYACRAGTNTRYYHGDDPAGLVKVARLINAEGQKDFAHVEQQVNFLKPGESFTAKVGSYQPNAWGLYDMLGNVWEWTGDWYGEDYYARSPLDDPRGPADANVKVRRGGGWNTFPLFARAAYRNWNTRGTRCLNLGFRVVCQDP